MSKKTKFVSKKVEEETEESEEVEESGDEQQESDTNESQSEDEDEQDESQQESQLKLELNKMSFEDIQKLQNKLGLKKFKEALNASKNSTGGKLNNFKRLNKNRPREESAKRPVSSLRQIFTPVKREIIDPRFNSAFGEYKPEKFRKQYDFVDDMRKSEKEMLEKELREEKDPIKKDQIKKMLQRIKQQLKANQEIEKQVSLKEKYKQQVMQDAKQGKKPHFINKSEQRLLDLADKYKQLKKSGKVEKFLAKKRKKQLSKDKKIMFQNNDAV